MSNIKKEKKTQSTFYVGKNIYDDEKDNEQIQNLDEYKYTFKDVVAITIAIYKMLFPFAILSAVMFLIAYSIIFYILL